MAAIKRRGERWHAEVRRANPPLYESGTFPTKQSAIAWATAIENQWFAGKRGSIVDRPFSALLERYRDEVSPSKRGVKLEQNRLNALLRDPIAAVRTRHLASSDAADWRDRRLKVVTAATVRRDWALICTVCNVAVQEWKWLQANPFKGVKKPAAPEARDRLPTGAEIAALNVASSYGPGPLTTNTQRAIAAFHLAIETGMRVGEICNLTWGRVDTAARVARLDKTKNGTKRAVSQFECNGG